MSWIDTTLVIAILILMLLLIWSRVMNQRILDTIIEIKDILKEVKK